MQYKSARPTVGERDELLGRIAALEAELSEWKGTMSCGHPRGCIVGSDEGTNYCSMCAIDAENAKLRAEVERLRKAGENILLLIKHETDLPYGAANGVTDAVGALDEGVCRASDIIEEMRAALRGESEDGA